MMFVETPEAPIPLGHYSQAVVANGLVFVAGQFGLLPGGFKFPEGGVGPQTAQALQNIASILAAAGSRLDKVVNVNILVTDIENWTIVNEVYQGVFGDHRPARAVSVSPQLHYGAAIEIQVIATA